MRNKWKLLPYPPAHYCTVLGFTLIILDINDSLLMLIKVFSKTKPDFINNKISQWENKDETTVN